MQRQRLPVETVADLGVGGLGILREQVARGEDHARRAEAALQPVLLPERVLQRMELAVLREALDRRDLRAVGLDREDRAGLHGLAVEEHRARAALAGVAADVGAGQAEGFAEVVDEEEPRLDRMLSLDAVDGDRDGVLHEGLPLSGGILAPGSRQDVVSISSRTLSKNADVSFFVTPPIRRAAMLATVPTTWMSADHARSVAPP